MKILILNTLYYPYKVGGAEKSVQLLAEDLRKTNQNVSVISLTERSSYSDIINGVKVYYLTSKNIYWPYDIEKSNSSIKKIIWHVFDTYLNLQKKQIEQIILDEKPDVVHVNNITGFSTQILKTLKNFNLPCIQTLRDYHYLCIKNTCYKNGNCVSLCKDCRITSTFKISQLNKYVDHVVGISDFIIGKHQKHGLKKGIPTSVIYNAVKSLKIKEQLTFKKSKLIRFGYVGAITEAKGVEDMFKKMSSHKLKRFQFEIKLAGVGSQDYIDNLKVNYGDLNIHFLGYQDSDKFFSNIDALIVPSLWEEPFGRIVIEGAQYHLPIFVSEHGALPELKEKIQGINFFNIKNIVQFLESPVQINNKYSLEDFKSITISKSYERIYTKLIENEN